MSDRRRIVIVGCGGFGKTVLARRLGATLRLPVTNLDALYYDDNWHPSPMEKFADLQRELVAAERWVIEGNYASTLPIRLASANTVIFLDVPAWTRLWASPSVDGATKAANTPTASTTASLVVREVHPGLPAQHAPAR